MGRTSGRDVVDRGGRLLLFPRISCRLLLAFPSFQSLLWLKKKGASHFLR